MPGLAPSPNEMETADAEFEHRAAGPGYSAPSPEELDSADQEFWKQKKSDYEQRHSQWQKQSDAAAKVQQDKKIFPGGTDWRDVGLPPKPTATAPGPEPQFNDSPPVSRTETALDEAIHTEASKRARKYEPGQPVSDRSPSEYADYASAVAKAIGKQNTPAFEKQVSRYLDAYDTANRLHDGNNADAILVAPENRDLVLQAFARLHGAQRPNAQKGIVRRTGALALQDLSEVNAGLGTPLSDLMEAVDPNDPLVGKMKFMDSLEKVRRATDPLILPEQGFVSRNLMGLAASLPKMAIAAAGGVTGVASMFGAPDAKDIHDYAKEHGSGSLAAGLAGLLGGGAGTAFFSGVFSRLGAGLTREAAVPFRQTVNRYLLDTLKTSSVLKLNDVKSAFLKAAAVASAGKDPEIGRLAQEQIAGIPDEIFQAALMHAPGLLADVASSRRSYEKATGVKISNQTERDQITEWAKQQEQAPTPPPEQQPAAAQPPAPPAQPQEAQNGQTPETQDVQGQQAQQTANEGGEERQGVLTPAAQPGAAEPQPAAPEKPIPAGSVRSDLDIANEIAASAKGDPNVNQDSPIAKGGEAFRNHWMESEKFTLQEIPLDSIEWRGPKGKTYHNAKSSGPVVIDKNRRDVGYRDDLGRTPNDIVLDGQNRVEAARQRGDKTIMAWVGDKQPAAPEKPAEPPPPKKTPLASSKEAPRAQGQQDAAAGKITPEAVKYAPLHELPEAAKLAMQQWAQARLQNEKNPARVKALNKIIEDAGKDVGGAVEDMKETLAKQAQGYKAPLRRDKGPGQQGRGGYKEPEDNRDPIGAAVMADPDTRDQMLDKSIAAVRAGQSDPLADRIKELLGTPLHDTQDHIDDINSLRDEGHTEANPEESFLQPTPQGKPSKTQFPDYGKQTQKTMLSRGGIPGQQDLFNTEGSEPEREPASDAPSDYIPGVSPLPPGTQASVIPIPPGVEKDLNAAAGVLAKVWDAVRATFSPTGISAESKGMAGIVRENAAVLSKQHEQARFALGKFSKALMKMPTLDRYKFIDSVETGSKIANPNMQKAADSIRNLLDEARDRVRALGTGKLDNFITNYFPHIWKDPAKAQQVFGVGKRPLEGSKAFLKKRTIPTTRDGLAAGLEPITDNPIDLVLLKLHEVNRYVMAQKILAEGKAAGYVKLFRSPGRQPDGWVQIDDKIGHVFQRQPTTTASGKQGAPQYVHRGDYYAHPDAGRILNNYLSPGLRGHGVYDAIRFAGNAMNMAQLGLSAFHVTGTTINSIVSRTGLAAKMAFEGNPVKGLAMAGKAWIAPVDALIGGSRVIREALQPGSQGQDFAQIVDALQAGGHRLGQDRMYRLGEEADTHWKGFLNKLKESRPSAIPAAFLAALEQSSRPMMEWYIPRMKQGVMLDMARYELSKMPSNATRTDLRETMREVVDSVDNRLGQLIYDNLFWNKTMKDVLMISTRSLGWNLGTLRELAGGARDIAKMGTNLIQGKRPELTHAASYAIALPFVVGILGAGMNYLYTGHGPQALMDLYHVPTGQKDSKGQDEKVQLPTYMRDAFSWTSNFGKTLLSKTHPLVAATVQALNNKDFYFHPIMNDKDPAVQQAIELAEYVGKQFVPFSITNMLERPGKKGKIAREGTLGEKVESFIGITPVAQEKGK